jgi:putative oxidoreductase
MATEDGCTVITDWYLLCVFGNIFSNKQFACGSKRRDKAMRLAHSLNHLSAEWQKRLGYVLDCVRVVLGIILVTKAFTFLNNREYLESMFTASKDVWFIPVMVLHYVIFAHLIGGICLIVGIFSRSAALIQIPVLLGAIFYVQLPRFFNAHEPQQLEYAIMVFLMLGVVLVHGGGRLSVDHFVWNQPTNESA